MRITNVGDISNAVAMANSTKQGYFFSNYLLSAFVSVLLSSQTVSSDMNIEFGSPEALVIL